ncbi:MAG: hypothetical protein HY000_33190 [Planctomycetes bacterium]|nr:hypothetical protein [Planctomycetota bacterium]
MASWHELFEAGGRTVATRGGITGLSGRSRLEVLRYEPADYLYYRFVWAEIRLGASALIPSESRPVTGELLIEAGAVSWREQATE